MRSTDDKRLQAAGNIPQETLDYLNSKKRTSKGGAIAGIGILLLLLVFGLAVNGHFANQKAAVEPDTVVNSTRIESVNVLTLKDGRQIRTLMTADEVFDIIPKSDERDVVSKPDPEIPSSLFVTRVYLIDGKAVEIAFSRLHADGDDGPYRVIRIEHSK